MRLLGITWYRGAGDYDLLKAMAKDGDKLPDTYADWLKTAQNVSSQMTLEGFTVVKVYLDPKTFPEWCKANGLEIDGKARSRYGTDFAGRAYEEEKLSRR